MTVFTSPAIKQLIVHRVHQKPDPATKATPDPILADLMTPLNAEVEAFLRDHIVRSDDDYRTRRAKFRESESNVVRAACDEIFASPGDVDVFVAHSRQIAEQLVSAERGKQQVDARISAGDLVVCLTSVEVGDGQGCPMLALLKIDSQDGFSREARSENGKTRIVLSRIGEILTDSRLQKCAFVFPRDRCGALGHDLAVLDLQTDSRNAISWAASYFVDRFLNCEVNLNPGEQLRVFVYNGGDWIDRQSTLSEAEKEWAKDQTIHETYAATVNVVDFAARIFFDPEERARYVAHLRSCGLRDSTFEPDPARRQRLAEFITFEGDGGLSLRVKRDDYGEDRLVEPVSQPDAEGKRRIVITTRNWKSRLPGAR